MRTLFVIVLLVGCGSSPASRVDAREEIDTGAVDRDAGPVVELDAFAEDAPTIDTAIGADVGAPPDAGADAWGTCDLFAQTGCAPGEACRRSSIAGELPHLGPPACEPAGELDEEESLPGGGCRTITPLVDQCAPGLFCTNYGFCARYCDPDGAPCPLLPGRTTPRTCRPPAESPGGLSYCH